MHFGAARRGGGGGGCGSKKRASMTPRPEEEEEKKREDFLCVCFFPRPGGRALSFSLSLFLSHALSQILELFFFPQLSFRSREEVRIELVFSIIILTA